MGQVHETVGNPIDAAFDVSASGDDFRVTLHARYGKRNPSQRSNADYVLGLRLVLDRLASLGAVLIDAYVDSREVQALSLDERRLGLDWPYPVQVDAVPTQALASAICRAQSGVGRRPGARGTGNQTRRAALIVELPMSTGDAAALEAELEYGIGGAVVATEADASVEGVLRPASSQGYRQSADERKAIELRAMRVAIGHFESLGYEVVDVSAERSYDLECRKATDLLHVEVKGTTGAGCPVLITAREVEHAENCVNPALAVVSVVSVSSTAEGASVAEGGELTVFSDWRPMRAGHLSARAYAWSDEVAESSPTVQHRDV